MKQVYDLTPTTIVAISTALSKSAISIVRLSGKDSLKIAYMLLDSSKNKNLKSKNLAPLTPRYAYLKKIYDKDGELLDKVIMIYFKAPHSYTGEDIIEIQSHGGSVIASEILQLCIRRGAILAKAGEFSKRAIKNNKLDMLELESTIALINSTNANLRTLLGRNLSGQFRSMLDSVREKIIEIIAQIEVNIDYSEEDLDSKILNKSLDTLRNIELKFKNIIDSTIKYIKMQNLNISIIGRPNVGKSSILNLLLTESRAIVSDIEGTTRDAIGEHIDINGNTVWLIDTAGIRQSDNKIEQMGIKKSYEYAKNSDILLCVFDLSMEMREEDFRVLEFLNSINLTNKYVLIVLNKNDLERKNTHDFSSFNHIAINTKDSNNTNILRDKIAKIITIQIDKDTLVLTSLMQKELLESALKGILNAHTLLRDGELELASFELAHSLESLGQIIKPSNIEDVLDSMFSQFCVGK